MPAFLKHKKFLICALATIMSAIAAIIAVSFTYAAFRSDIINNGGATVAGAVAEYVRGSAYRNGTEITYNEAEGGGITISELSPNDFLTYNFSIDGFKEDGRTTIYNQVLLRITCEFSFTYAYIEGTASTPTVSSLSALSMSDGVQSYVSFLQKSSLDNADYETITNVSEGTDTVYYDVKASNSSWEVKQNSSLNTEYVEYTQKFGFYLYPVSSRDEEGASQALGFNVQIPAQSGSSEESNQFRLTIKMKFTAEQVLNTSVGTTG